MCMYYSCFANVRQAGGAWHVCTCVLVHLPADAILLRGACLMSWVNLSADMLP